jgi:hypothetical protein
MTVMQPAPTSVDNPDASDDHLSPDCQGGQKAGFRDLPRVVGFSWWFVWWELGYEVIAAGVRASQRNAV